MSTFQKKYYYTFKPLDYKVHTVEIWQNTALTLTPIQVIGAPDPFIVSLSGLNDKLEPVRGTGADLNLFATSSMQYMDLYTSTIQEYQVRHYIDGNLNWCGYLDTELFSSDISKQKNYTVSITANDGFALLDQMTYLQSNTLPFTGISSQYSILQYIISKLNLPYNNIYIGLSTTIPGVTIAASETIFNKIYVKNANFYDEDGVPMTLREVLDSTLRSLGAFIIQSNGSLYITDIQSMVSGSTFTFKKYDNSLTYVGTESSKLTLIGDLSTLKFAGSTQTLNIVPAYNKAVVSYSPYPIKDIIDFKAEEDFYNTDGFTGITINYKPSTGYNAFWWNETNYMNSKTWTNTNNGKFIKMWGATTGNEDMIDYYLKIDKYGTGAGYLMNSSTLSFKCKLDLPFIIPSKYKIKVNAKSFIRTIDTLGNEAVDVTKQMVYIEYFCKVKIGNKQYSYSPTQLGATHLTKGWVDLANSGYYSMVFSIAPTGSTNINYVSENEWIDLKWYSFKGDYVAVPNDYMIPLTGFSGGQLEFEIYGFRVWPSWSYIPQLATSDSLMASVKDVRLKDITFSLVDENNNPVGDSDIEYVGIINPMYKGDGNKIDIKQGTNITGNPLERGDLVTYDGTTYSWLNQFTRGGTTDIIENLLLRTYVGNYENKNIAVTATVKQLPSNVGYLTYDYPSTLTGKKFMLTAFTNNYANNSSEITMQEVFADSLNINKTY